jgi:hypothetical protein
MKAGSYYRKRTQYQRRKASSKKNLVFFGKGFPNASKESGRINNVVSAAEMAGAKETAIDPHKKKSMHHHESFKVEAP